MMQRHLFVSVCSIHSCGSGGVQVRSGLTEAVKQDHVVKLHFTDVGKLPPPVLQFINVTFGYSPDRVLYSDVRTCTHLPHCNACTLLLQPFRAMFSEGFLDYLEQQASKFPEGSSSRS